LDVKGVAAVLFEASAHSIGFEKLELGPQALGCRTDNPDFERVFAENVYDSPRGENGRGRG
jgi:hypothetical protein